MKAIISVQLPPSNDADGTKTRDPGFFFLCMKPPCTWQIGVGAIFGLLGSKATDLFPAPEDENEDE